MVQHREQITRHLIEQLESAKRDGTPLPWHKPWSGSLAVPHNAVTQAPYRGGNQFWLLLMSMAHEYPDPRWCTARQANAAWSYTVSLEPETRASAAGVLQAPELSSQEKERALLQVLYPRWNLKVDDPEHTWVRETIRVHRDQGTLPDTRRIRAHVRRGEHGVFLTHWHFPNAEEVAERQARGLRRPDRATPFGFTVFNLSQVEGAPALEQSRKWSPLERAERLIAASGAKLSHQHVNQAYYHPESDQIVLPPRSAFAEQSAYYGVALHELGHWTGAKQRLNRTMNTDHASPDYAREELRAELISLFLAAEVGIAPNTRNSAAYVDVYLELLRGDSGAKEIFLAANDAQAAVDYILELERKLAPTRDATPERAGLALAS